MTEAAITIGYYSLVSFMLNGFEADLVASMTDPFN